MDGGAPRSSTAAAFGGAKFSRRDTELRDELGTHWAPWGVASEWRPLRGVLLHRPGAELDEVSDPDANLMLKKPDPVRMRTQHDALADAYRREGVAVHYVDPPEVPPPNQMFCADTFLMPPEGAIVGRPASHARAGEERWIAARLAALGIPILRTVRGAGTFEGADALWLAPDRVLLGCGFRTNAAGVAQVAATLGEQGVETVSVEVPDDAMHLMGLVRIVDQDLACVHPTLTPRDAVVALEDAGHRVLPFPSPEEIRTGMGPNFVTLGPRRVVLPAGNPRTRGTLEAAGVECVDVAVDAIAPAAGAIGCLTGVLGR